MNRRTEKLEREARRETQAEITGAPDRWVLIVPVLSTAHIKPDTLDRLSEMDHFKVHETPEGAFVWLGADTLIQAPRELRPIITWMRQEYPGQQYVRFDQDGDEIEDLPRYKW